jgi:pyruvate/2-oxoglutarate dehydrogenase complex dihydrolipoamide acyltransferase (E2) component
MIPISLPNALWSDADAETEALLDAWHVAVGDRVSAGQTIATVVVIKAGVDLQAPSDGVISAILVPAGETFARGAQLATLQQ